MDREGELADLEKIMDSFDAEEKIIGTIVKVDGDRLQVPPGLPSVQKLLLAQLRSTISNPSQN